MHYFAIAYAWHISIPEGRRQLKWKTQGSPKGTLGRCAFRCFPSPQTIAKVQCFLQHKFPILSFRNQVSNLAVEGIIIHYSYSRGIILKSTSFSSLSKAFSKILMGALSFHSYRSFMLRLIMYAEHRFIRCWISMGNSLRRQL